MKILFLGPQCPALESCFLEKGHTFIRTEEPLSLVWVREERFDFGVSYRYKKIIRRDVIEFFAGRLINMHISFLPWNRGVDPNLWSHIENTPKGVTIHRVDAGLDTGDILLQKKVSFDAETDTLRTSYDKLSRAIEDLFIENAEDLFADTIPATPQTGGGSFHFSKDGLTIKKMLGKQGFDIKIAELAEKLRGGVRLFNFRVSCRPRIMRAA